MYAVIELEFFFAIFLDTAGPLTREAAVANLAT